MKIHPCLLLSLVVFPTSSLQRQQHIILLIGDDIGHRDLGFHGTNEIQTPNLDAMAYNGIELNGLYTQPSCSPSRTALLTGNYPIRSGMQGYATLPGEDINVPLTMPLMSEQLRKLNYSTHIVGKWHLGFSRPENTPLGRGFDSHTGIWTGYCGYFTYLSRYGLTGVWGKHTIAIANRTYLVLSNGYSISYEDVAGFDLHKGLKSDWAHNGTYVTSYLTNQALDIIHNHSTDKPLFLVVAYTAAHTADGNELGVPDIKATNARFSYIPDEYRRRYATIMSTIDDSVGDLYEALAAKQMLNDSIILFISDNGGPTSGTLNNTGSNWPLRGTKNTYFQGGIKGSGALYSASLQKRGYRSNALIHLVDMLPTFYGQAGGNVKSLGAIDGVDQWETLSLNTPSRRSELLIDIDDVYNYSGIVSHHGKYKLVQGSFDNPVVGMVVSAHQGSSGRGGKIPKYNVDAVVSSKVNKAIASSNVYGGLTKAQIRIYAKKRQGLLLHSKTVNSADTLNCTAPSVCLFNLKNDPGEFTNIAATHPDIVQKLQTKIQKYWKHLVPQTPRFVYGPESSPVRYNNTWCTWLEDDLCEKTVT